MFKDCDKAQIKRWNTARLEHISRNHIRFCVNMCQEQPESDYNYRLARVVFPARNLSYAINNSRGIKRQDILTKASESVQRKLAYRDTTSMIKRIKKDTRSICNNRSAINRVARSRKIRGEDMQSKIRGSGLYPFAMIDSPHLPHYVNSVIRCEIPQITSGDELFAN